MEKLLCPNCECPTIFDSVDVGIGNVSGPAYCPKCGWAQEEYSTVQELAKKIKKTFGQSE